MAELTARERLQPCLLDRLTDDEPDKLQEGRDMRVVTIARYRQAVLRDISWLLNSESHAAGDDVCEFEHVARSVLNFGIPDVCGLSAQSTSVQDLEHRMVEALEEFEPRIARGSLSVRATVDPEKMSGTAVVFEITGELWAQPANVALYIKTAVDLETGRADVVRSEK